MTGYEQGELSHVGRVVGVMSGKGGVGKSSVTALLAAALARRGHIVGVMDADITGPSMPKMFGVHGRLETSDAGIFPAFTERFGIRVVSLNLLLDEEEAPVVWRGPLLSGAVKQFWTDVVWGDLDFMIIDLPPGTGDVPLSVMQSIPLDGLVTVSSPQDVAVLVVKKAVQMARMMNKPVIGLVENMSQIACPKCGEVIYPFGKPRGAELARELGVKFIGELPIDPRLSELADAGLAEEYEHPTMEALADAVVAATSGPEASEDGKTKRGGSESI
ncbi:MAG: Mrp/NBP35 family ATP-binding protein [Clostridia bacterium]|nr:Mrp/NBP35 family ATP-binding protein [Clostridia bacterium]